MRKIGRDIVKASEVGNLVFQDEGIIECRIRIHKIHDRMNIIHQLILNETKFAILAYLSLEETLSSTNKQEWLEISKEIQSNIRNYHEEISLSLQPELKAEIELLDNLLEVKMPAAVKSANLAVYEEESVISEDKFSPVKKRIKETSMKCVDMVNDIEKVSSAFDNIVKVNTNAQMKTSEVYTLLRPLFQMGDNRSLMIGPVSWTSTLIALAQARLDPQDRDEELEHLNRCINLCSRVQVQLRAHIADIIPATFNSMRVHGDQEQSWQSRFESVRLLDAMFPGNNIRARCLETFKSISWTTEIVKIIQSDRPLADKKAELEFINQMLKLSYEPARYKAALQVIGSKFVSAGSDENSGLTWRKRRESIALLTDVFKSEDPQAIRGENIDLRYQAFRSLKEIEESGRRLFTQSEQAKMVFDCADIPLILAKFDYENRKSELVTPELFQKNFEAWVAAARQLLPELADKTPRAPDASIDTSKVEQFLILTICRNLGLTDMRCEDMAVLRKICRTYLQNSQEIAKVQFPLQVVDTLEKRLNYLAIHLSCLITTLTPLATLYNTGHVRNMDLDTSNALLEGLKKKGNYIIVRTSSGNPATITCSSLLNEQIKQIRKEGGHIKKDESFPVNNVAIITSEGERIEFEVFHLFNYRAQKDMYQCSVPALVLLPYAQLMRAEAEIQAEFRQAEGVIQDQYRFAHADVRPSSHSAQQTVSTSLAGVFDFRDQGERSVVNDNNTPQSVAPRNNGPAPK